MIKTLNFSAVPVSQDGNNNGRSNGKLGTLSIHDPSFLSSYIGITTSKPTLMSA